MSLDISLFFLPLLKLLARSISLSLRLQLPKRSAMGGKAAETLSLLVFVLLLYALLWPAAWGTASAAPRARHYLLARYDLRFLYQNTCEHTSLNHILRR